VLAFVSSGCAWGWYEAEVSRRIEKTRRRDDALRVQIDYFGLLGSEAVRRKDWETARTQLSSALALIRSEPRQAETRKNVEGLLALSNRSIAEQKSRESARNRFSNYQRLYDEAVFYQSEYTGMDAEANLQAGRAAARVALAQFGLATGEPVALKLDPAYFDPREVERIVDGCYELTLLLAEAESQPLKGEDRDRQAREALRVLDEIQRLRTPTPEYHLRRASYLDLLEDRAGARDQRRLARTATVSGGSAIDDFLTGERAYRKGDLKSAVVSLQRALSLQPDHFWAQYLLAVCHLRAHRPAEAQAALIACQSRRPAFIWPYLLKGFAEGEMGEFDLAEADFRRAAELGLTAQARYVMLVNRGVMRVQRGREKEAIDDLSAAIALQPDHFQAYISLSQAYQNLKQWSDALASLDQAIARAPDQAVLFRARSQVQRLCSHPDAALKDLDAAIKRSTPDDPFLVSDHLERGLLLQQAGRSEEALAACDAAIKLEPDRTDAHRLRGIALVKLKRHGEAIRSFDICLARGKAPQAIYEVRGLTRAWSGSYELAVADYTMALNVGRGTPSLYANRGWAYLLSGAPSLALRDFDDALRLDPSTGHALGGRAMAYVQLRRPQEAVTDARHSVRLNPNDARQMYNAARVMSQAAVCLEADSGRSSTEWAAAGRFRAEALEFVVQARNLYPETDRARFWDEVVRRDPAIEPVRRARKFIEMDARVSRPTRPNASNPVQLR
jgi:eukaryotic-like serine/threonine-protein kinase